MVEVIDWLDRVYHLISMPVPMWDVHAKDMEYAFCDFSSRSPTREVTSDKAWWRFSNCLCTGWHSNYAMRRIKIAACHCSLIMFFISCSSGVISPTHVQLSDLNRWQLPAKWELGWLHAAIYGISLGVGNLRRTSAHYDNIKFNWIRLISKPLISSWVIHDQTAFDLWPLPQYIFS